MSVLLLLGDNLVTSQAERSRLSRTDSGAVRHSLWGGGDWEGGQKGVEDATARGSWDLCQDQTKMGEFLIGIWRDSRRRLGGS